MTTTEEARTHGPLTFDHLRSAKKPRKTAVPIVLDDDVADEFDAAKAEYDEAKANFEAAQVRDRVSGRNGSGSDDVADAAERLHDAETRLSEARAEMEDQVVYVRFQSIGRKAYEDLVRAHPPTEEQKKRFKKDFGSKHEAPYDVDKFPVALIAACAYEPAMTEEQVQEMIDGEEWNEAEVTALFVGANQVNTQRRTVELGKEPGSTPSDERS